MPTFYFDGKPEGYEGDDIQIQGNTSVDDRNALYWSGSTPETRDAHKVLNDAFAVEFDPEDAAAQTAYDEAVQAATKTLGEARTRGESAYGELLVRIYGGKTYTLRDSSNSKAYTLDFSTPDAARKTMEDTSLPGDIADWLGLAIGVAVEMNRERLRDRLPKQLRAGGS